jgi:hypothetical protein
VLDRWFATPSNHRVHHAVNDVYVDRNYGGILMVWDRLFGSFQPELPGERCVYGTRDPVRSWNPLWANLQVYVALFRDAWHARAWADKWRVFVRRPGWRPADVAARLPTAPFRLPLEKFAPALPRRLGAYCLAQLVGVISLGAYFLAVEPRLSRPAALAWFAALAVSLWIIGGLAEGRRGFVPLEAARLAAFALLGVVALAGAPAALAVLVVGAAALGAWLFQAARDLPAAAVA